MFMNLQSHSGRRLDDFLDGLQVPGSWKSLERVEHLGYYTSTFAFVYMYIFGI